MARADDVVLNNGNATAEISENLSSSEAAVYDRQIRLWGIEAQNKLRHSRVLLVGLKGLGAEVAKNLVLCGLNSMTLIDGETTTEDDLLSNFFLPKDAVGKERGLSTLPGVQALNPLVKLDCVKGIEEVDLSSFSLVVLSDQPYAVMKEVDEKCRAAGVRFIGASLYGWVGYAHFDFNGHEFLVKKEKPLRFCEIDCEGGEGKKEEEETVEEEEDQWESRPLSFPSYTEVFDADIRTSKLTRQQKRKIPSSFFPIRALLRMEEAGLLTGEEGRDIGRLTECWVDELRRAETKDDLQTILPEQFEYLFGPQLSPACAVLGGMIGQESIKALTGGKLPYRNLMLYSALNAETCVVDFPFTLKK